MKFRTARLSAFILLFASMAAAQDIASFEKRESLKVRGGKGGCQTVLRVFSFVNLRTLGG